MASETISATGDVSRDESHQDSRDDAHGGAHGGGHATADFAHPSPVRTLIVTFVALVALTILTVLVAALFDMGRFEVWVSLGIATVKAALVICFFMHMLHDKPFNALFFLSSFFFASLFIGFTLMDSSQYQHEIESLDAEDVPVHKIGEPRLFDFTGAPRDDAE